MQISDDLISYICGELMKKLGQNNFDPTPSPLGKTLLQLAGPTSSLSTPTLAKLQERFDIFEFKEWGAKLSPNCPALITELSIQALVRVAEGDEGCTLEGRLLLNAILNGQAAIILNDGVLWRRQQATAPKALLHKYRHYESVLHSYGVKFVDEDEIINAISGQRTDSPKAFGLNPSASSVNFNGGFQVKTGGRKVISENDIMALCPVARGENQSLSLGPKDILTPLAQDYAKIMKINIINA